MPLKRVLLKISGEMLGSATKSGIDPVRNDYIVKEIVSAARCGVELAIVVGGGNFFRGASFQKTGMINRVTADTMGMLGTIMNGMWLRSALQGEGLNAFLLNSIPLPSIADPFVPDRALEIMKNGGLLILTGGTGNPFFTTDTAAVLRALEIGADLLLKGTKVDGVFSGDPRKNSTATLFHSLSHYDALRQGLRVMDSTAFSLANEGDLEIIVFNLGVRGNLCDILEGKEIGTRITCDY